MQMNKDVNGTDPPPFTRAPSPIPATHRKKGSRGDAQMAGLPPPPPPSLSCEQRRPTADSCVPTGSTRSSERTPICGVEGEEEGGGEGQPIHMAAAQHSSDPP